MGRRVLRPLTNQGLEADEALLQLHVFLLELLRQFRGKLLTDVAEVLGHLLFFDERFLGKTLAVGPDLVDRLSRFFEVFCGGAVKLLSEGLQLFHFILEAPHRLVELLEPAEEVGLLVFEEHNRPVVRRLQFFFHFFGLVAFSGDLLEIVGLQLH